MEGRKTRTGISETTPLRSPSAEPRKQQMPAGAAKQQKKPQRMCPYHPDRKANYTCEAEGCKHRHVCHQCARLVRRNMFGNRVYGARGVSSEAWECQDPLLR